MDVEDEHGDLAVRGPDIARRAPTPPPLFLMQCMHMRQDRAGRRCRML